jgi:hypothetical protein
VVLRPWKTAARNRRRLFACVRKAAELLRGVARSATRSKYAPTHAVAPETVARPAVGGDGNREPVMIDVIDIEARCSARPGL